MKHVLLIALAAILFASCGTQQKVGYSPYGTSNWSFSDGTKTEEQGKVSESTGRTDKLFDADKRMVIYNSRIQMAVKQTDSVNVQLVALAGKYEGYVVSSGNYETVIRVKAPLLQNAVNDISLLGKVTGKYMNGSDVTEEFTDYHIRLDNADSARQRYLKLLAKAENVQAALLVEKELERLNGEIELLKGKMNKIEHLTDYSTITVNMYVESEEKKPKPGPLGYIFVGLYYGVKWLFVR